MLSVANKKAPLVLQRRSDRRVAYLEPCFIQTDSHALWVRSINLSDGGMCIAVNEFGILKRGTNVAIFVDSFAPIDGQVRWTRGNIAGLKFLTPIVHHPELSELIKQLHQGGEARSPIIAKNIVDAKLPKSLHQIFNPTPVQSEEAKPDNVNQRAHKRLDYTEKCLIRTGKRTFQADSKNISEGGICLKLLGLGKINVGANVQIILEGGYPPIAGTLRWINPVSQTDQRPSYFRRYAGRKSQGLTSCEHPRRNRG